MTLAIDLRDPRLEKGRMRIAAGTDDPAERDRRKATILQLLDSERGQVIVRRLRSRELTIDQVHEAVQAFDIARLDKVEPPKPKKDPEPIGLGATIDGWFRYLEGVDRAPQTIETYRVVAASIEAHFGVRREGGRIVKDRPVGDISRFDGERWLTGDKPTTGAPWAPSTQRVAHSLAAQIWDRAIAEDEERHEKHGAPRTVTRNFWRRQGARKGVKGGRIRRTRVEFLRRREAGRLLRSIRGTPHAAWIAIGIYAGLRGGEAANLRLNVDVDLKRGVLRIQGRDGEHAWRTKTENSQRQVPIHPRLARWLRAHIAAGYAGQVYLFTNPKQDRPLSRSGWRWWTKTAFEAGGIRYGRKKDALTYHSLRHTFASWLTMADVHPLKIARLMGDTVEMVMKTYAHLIDQDLEGAIRRL